MVPQTGRIGKSPRRFVPRTGGASTVPVAAVATGEADEATLPSLRSLCIGRCDGRLLNPPRETRRRLGGQVVGSDAGWQDATATRTGRLRPGPTQDGSEGPCLCQMASAAINAGGW